MSQFTDLLHEMKFMLEHVQRHHNELIFIKCLNTGCPQCSKNQIKAKQVFEFLNQYEMKFFSPMPSENHPGHYCTFLEMIEKPPKEVQFSVVLWYAFLYT